MKFQIVSLRFQNKGLTEAVQIVSLRFQNKGLTEAVQIVSLRFQNKGLTQAVSSTINNDFPNMVSKNIFKM